MLRWLRRINSDDWGAGFLGLSRTENHPSRGLIMIQIDGFSRSNLEKALDRGEMPFLKRLLIREKYRLHSLYPGLPSSTPAVQGELFYGVKQIVPAFFYFDQQSRKFCSMFDGDAAREVERKLADQGQGLLEGGSSYSNIFSGGAEESHFCSVSLGWKHLRKQVNPLKFLIFLLTQFPAFVWISLLCIWETFLALVNFLFGLLKRRDFWAEIKFIPLRVLLGVLLRELIVLGASMDAARGLPVIHLNMIGYDEMAHHYGPDSVSARWSLRGIDKGVAKITRAAARSQRRHYDVWVYSDHGQEHVIPYAKHYGVNVEDAVKNVFESLFSGTLLSSPADHHRESGSRSSSWARVRYLGAWMETLWPLKRGTGSDFKSSVQVAVMGPVGGVYVLKRMTRDQKMLFAKTLVVSAQIPMVMMPEDNGGVRVWTEKGEFFLPRQANDVLEAKNLYADEIVRDLMEMCHHADAGTLTISGWRKDDQPFSFSVESGAHAGPGARETDAFALLPSDAVSSLLRRPYLKISDVRQAAFDALKGLHYPRVDARPKGKIIRIMTYNVHSCVGTDGKLSPERIARVIARHQPDIVALQELDIGHKRTGRMDQPHLIAKELEMMYHFYASVRVEEEHFGNAILSRYPMKLIRADQLPQMDNRFSPEPRGAMMVSVEINGVLLRVINAHLSYYAPECLLQARELAGSGWAVSSANDLPVVLCGDLNCFPDSRPWLALHEQLQDAQRIPGLIHRPLGTWYSHYPVSRIDHVFVGPGIRVATVDVPRTGMDKTASDHLPLIVDLQLSH